MAALHPVLAAVLGREGGTKVPTTTRVDSTIPLVYVIAGFFVGVSTRRQL
jgi:hypothetical protein